MSFFDFQAKKGPKEWIQGEVEASSFSGAIEKIEGQGLCPIWVKEKRAKIFLKTSHQKLSRKALIHFTGECADLLRGQVNLSDALKLISTQSPYASIRSMSFELLQKVREGLKFSKALEAYPKIFSPFYLGIVRSGEFSGSLDLSMERLAHHFEQDQSFRSKVLEALIYPSFLLGMGVVSVMVLVLFVVPRLSPMFEDMGKSLPFLTQILIKVSEMVMDYGVVLIFLLCLLILFFLRIIKQPKKVFKIQSAVLQIPFVGSFIQARYLSEIFESLQTMMDNGISPIEALKITGESCSFYPYREALETIKVQMMGGQSLSQSLEHSSLFPAKVAMILKVGEESGQMEFSLKKLAQNYVSQFEKITQIATKIMGPLFIILLGGFVGLIILAMLLPILELNVAF